MIRDFFLGFVKIHILHHAAEGAVYGAAITAELRRHGYDLSPGTLYPILHRAGLLGGLAAWLGFTLPSALALVAFAYWMRAAGVTDAGWLHGLKVVAVAVVAQAVWGLARNLAADRQRASLMILAAIAVLASRTASVQVLVLVVAGVAGWWLLPGAGTTPTTVMRVPVGKTAWPARSRGSARQIVPSHALAVVDSLYRAGSLVFGGGHVVLPLLQAEVVPPGWVTNEEFLAGYGAAQAVPGPLFTFAAYLGAVMHGASAGRAALAALS